MGRSSVENATQGARGGAGVVTRSASVRGKQGVAAREFLELLHLLVRQAIKFLLNLFRERVGTGSSRLHHAHLRRVEPVRESSVAAMAC